MAVQPGQAEPSKQEQLSERIERYRAEIEKIVRGLGEHPLFELKRSCDLSNIPQRMEFVKDVQSIATSRISTEKYLVIGADASAKNFVGVSSPAQFDEARIRPILEKYLAPVPSFEVLQLSSSDGLPFVLFVFPKQPTRRVLARVTVDEPTDPKPKILLREGDLWTKGESTAKHLAKPEDWDDIYEDRIEREAESRTRTRTAHFVDQALAQERVRTSSTPDSLPVYLTDDEFKALIEEICLKQDSSRLALLLERMRDDVVEGWNKAGAVDDSFFTQAPEAITPDITERTQKFRDDIFRPSLNRLTFLGLLLIKNSGQLLLFQLVLNLLKEVFEMSHTLRTRMLVPYGSRVDKAFDHLSYTLPAIEALVTLHILGSYVVRRRRFKYMRSILDLRVYRLGAKGLSELEQLSEMAFWPVRMGQGEARQLQFRAGRIDLCVERILADPAILGLFGAEGSARRAMCEYEFCLELNSYLCVQSDKSPHSANYATRTYPGVDFQFWTSFIAFSLEAVGEIATLFLREIDTGIFTTLNQVLLDESLPGYLVKPNGRPIYLRFLAGIEEDHDKLTLQLNQFDFATWPSKLREAIESLNKTA